MEFQGFVTRVEQGTAASDVTSIGLPITISGSTVTVGETTWQGEVSATYAGHMLHGQVAGTPYWFMICKGTRRIVAVVYEGFGDGKDPGTWEGDESGTGEG